MACAIRGATDAPKFRDFILPLVFYKRLSDVFDDEFARYTKECDDQAMARSIIEAEHEDALATTIPVQRSISRGVVNTPSIC